MPKTIQRSGYVETEYGPLESYYGAIFRDRGTDIVIQSCGTWRSLVPQNAILDEPPIVFDRVYTDGTRKIGRKYASGPSEELIWTIKPDGSASYTRSLISMDIVGPIDSEQVCSMEGKVTKTMFTPSPGFSTARYDFTPEGLALFRKVASLYPNGFTDRSRYNEFPVWQAWAFPFEQNDSNEVRSWILSMHPADVLALYYTLLEYNGENQNVYGGSSICKTRKYISAVTPEEFKKNGFWSPYQEMLIRAIWDLRTDLRKVKDPKTGQVVDGIIDYRLFIMPCIAGKRGMIAQAVAGLALGVLTIGASTALQSSLTAINAAKSAVSVADQQNKINAMRDFASKVVIGFQTAADPTNIINPLAPQDPTKPPGSLNLTQRDLSLNPTSYDAQPVDDKPVNIAALAGVLIGAYYLLS